MSTMRHEHFPYLQHTLGFNTTHELQTFVTHSCIQTPFEEFILDYFDTNRDINHIDERGWYAVIRSMTSIHLYTWPHQNKQGWGHEQHVARFVFQVHHLAERSNVEWWQRNRDDEDYASWGYQLFELLLVLCEGWLGHVEGDERVGVTGTEEVVLMEGEIGPADDVAQDVGEVMLAVRELFAEDELPADENLPGEENSPTDDVLAQDDREPDTGRNSTVHQTPPAGQTAFADDESFIDEVSTTEDKSPAIQGCLLRRSNATTARMSLRLPSQEKPTISKNVPKTPDRRLSCGQRSVTNQDTTSNQKTSVTDESHAEEDTLVGKSCSLRRSNATTGGTFLSKRRRVSMKRAASKPPGGAWASSPLPWRRSGPDNWPDMRQE